MLLVPKYSDIKSRSEIDISVDLGKTLQLEFPILASPMDTISETQMAIALDKVGGAAVIHRYNSIDEQAEIIAKAVKNTKTLVQQLALPATTLREPPHFQCWGNIYLC